MNNELKPYRVEWRPNLLTRWLRIVDLDKHPGDLQEWVERQERSWVGYWRLVQQHVISEAAPILEKTN